MVQQGHEVVCAGEHGGDAACEVPEGVLGGDEGAARAGYFGEEREAAPVGVVEKGSFAAGYVDEDLQKENRC